MKLEFKCKEWITVARSDLFELAFDFTEGDIVSYQFKTKCHDIGFSVGLNGKIEIVSNSRQESDKRVIDGSFTVRQSGSYKFRFDNTYSWTKGKQVKLNVKRNAEVLFPL